MAPLTASKHGAAVDLIDWGIASLALGKDRESGDRSLIKPFRSGVLIAVVDGLGHGEEAAKAARIAVSELSSRPQESVISMAQRCHEALQATRGVVMCVASLNTLHRTVTWLSVGNVEGILMRPAASESDGHAASRETVLQRAGVVGYQLPPLRAMMVPLSPGDTLVFATDGIRPDFAEGVILSDSPQQIANRLLTKYNKGTDDALVLAARYLGP